jgi:hypothetical protein
MASATANSVNVSTAVERPKDTSAQDVSAFEVCLYSLVCTTYAAKQESTASTISTIPKGKLPTKGLLPIPTIQEGDYLA